MKKLLLILLPFLVLSAFKLPEGVSKNDREKDNIKGAVKMITETAYTATYGDSGKPGPGEFEHIFITNYNVGGMVTGKESEAKDHSLLAKSTCTFDKKGVKTGMENFNADGSIDTKETYKYDNKGNLIESKIWGSDGKQTEKFTWKYDEKGNPTDMYDYNEKDSLTLKYKYTWNAGGYNTKIEGYNGVDGLISTITMDLDDNGNMLKWKGDYSHVNSTDFAYAYTYVYDKTGNWTRRLKFQNGYEIEIVDRIIVYY